MSILISQKSLAHVLMSHFDQTQESTNKALAGLITICASHHCRRDQEFFVLFA